MNQTNQSKNKKVSILGLTRIFSFIVVILSIATIFNDSHRLLELFSHFKLQYFLASITFSLIFFWSRQYKLSTAMMMIAMLNLIYILPWYLNVNSNSRNLNSAHPVKSATTLKLIQSNVHTSNSNYQALIDLVIEESPDLLITQEVNQKWITELSKIENLLPYKKVKARDDNFGIAIFSRYPLDESEIVYFGFADLPSIKVSFTINKKQVTLITSHTLPPINKQYYELRNDQIEALSLASKKIQNPLILIGDFNITMWSKDYQLLEESAKLTNTRKGFGLLPTWPANLLPLMIPIDQCLVSNEWTVLDMAVGRDVGSDHLPLIVTLGLPN